MISRMRFSASRRNSICRTLRASRRGVATSATRITGGTGAWKSLRGMMHSASTFDSDPQKGYSQADNKGEYWFDE